MATAASGAALTGEISFTYQTQTWGAPARLAIAVVDRVPGKVTVEATLLDAHGILCLDASNIILFSIAGEAKLIDNQGTSNGSRRFQLANGRGRISIRTGKSSFTAGVSAEGIVSAFDLVENG